MKMNEKIEIMLSRKRIRKTDFAQSIGVTYRAFANYMNGSRKPRESTLNKIAELLQLSPDFLTDDSQALELTIEETFLSRLHADENEKAQAAQFLAQSRGLFAGNFLADKDKEALLRCLWDIYEDSRMKKGNAVK